MEQKNTWLVKVCCVIAAFSLWFYIINVGDSEVTRQVTVSVNPINIESVTERKLAILPGQKFSVTLNVKGSPADIELYKDQFKVVADMSMYALSKGEIRIPVRIDRQPVNVTILNSGAYYVKVNFDDYMEKTVSVKVNLQGKVKDGFYAFSQNIEPREVVVSGPAKFVSQVTAVSAQQNIDNTDKDLDVTLPLKAVDAKGEEVENVTLDQHNVKISVPVKRTKTVGIKVTTKGKINNDLYLRSLTPNPEKVDIAGGDVINSIANLETEPIDLSTITESKTISIKILNREGITLLDSDGTINVKVVVEKIVQQSFQLNIGMNNLNEAYNAELDIKKTTIKISAPESVMNGIKSENFSCSIDLASVNTEGQHSVQVNAAIPEGTERVSLSPQTVKVTLKKKEAPVSTEPTGTQTTPTNGGQ